MKKRLRKKNHYGEFTEYCIILWVKFQPWKTQGDGIDFFDKFAEEVLNPMGLQSGGVLGDVWDIAIVKKGRGSITEQHNNGISEWLVNCNEVINFSLSELHDAWNDHKYYKYNEEKDLWIKK